MPAFADTNDAAVSAKVDARGLRDGASVKRFIVTLKNTGANDRDREGIRSTAKKVATRLDGNDVVMTRVTAAGSQVIQLARPLGKAAALSAMTEIAKRPDVATVEVDVFQRTRLTHTDPDWATSQWHYHGLPGGIFLDQAHDLTQGLYTTGPNAGQPVVAAVVDTGFTDHPDLLPNLRLGNGADMISDTLLSNDGDVRDMDAHDPGDWYPDGYCDDPNDPPATPTPGEDSSWHGTHVSGTVAAAADNGQGGTGVAPKASLLPIRALGRCGGYTSDIADGLAWSAGVPVPGMPTNPNKARVVNLSLGGSDINLCPAEYQRGIDAAYNAGTVVTVAAGNEDWPIHYAHPGNCQHVISVGATDDKGNRASFSEWGPALDISAPGSGIWSTINDGLHAPMNSIYGTMSGTSMAAPHVAGVVALMASVNPNLTPDQIEEILKRTARPFSTFAVGDMQSVPGYPAMLYPWPVSGVTDSANPHNQMSLEGSQVPTSTDPALDPTMTAGLCDGAYNASHKVGCGEGLMNAYFAVKAAMDHTGPTADFGGTTTVTVPVNTAMTKVVVTPKDDLPRARITTAPTGLPSGVVWTPNMFTDTANTQGGLPNFSGGTLTGTPTTPGTYPVTFTVVDVAGNTAQQVFTIVVPAPADTAAPTVTAAPANQTIVQGSPIAPVTVAATDDPGAVTITAPAMPAGLTWDAATGTISGTPTGAAGTTLTLAFVATDAAGKKATVDVTITVQKAPVTPPATTAPKLPKTGGPAAGFAAVAILATAAGAVMLRKRG